MTSTLSVRARVLFCEEETEFFISESEEEQNDSTAFSSTESRQIAEIDFLVFMRRLCGHGERDRVHLLPRNHVFVKDSQG